MDRIPFAVRELLAIGQDDELVQTREQILKELTDRLNTAFDGYVVADYPYLIAALRLSEEALMQAIPKSGRDLANAIVEDSGVLLI